MSIQVAAGPITAIAAIRLEIVKALVPVSSRHGLTCDEIVETARKLESYVVDSAPNGEEIPDSPNRGTLTLPRKDKPSEAVPEFMTPPQVDKSNQKRR